MSATFCPMGMSVGRLLPLFQDDLAGDAAIGAHNAPTGMRGRAANEEVIDRSAVIGPAGNGAEKEKLFERKFALKNVALRKAKFALEIERSENLFVDDDVFDVWGMLRNCVDDVVAESL